MGTPAECRGRGCNLAAGLGIGPAVVRVSNAASLGRAGAGRCATVDRLRLGTGRPPGRTGVRAQHAPRLRLTWGQAKNLAGQVAARTGARISEGFSERFGKRPTLAKTFLEARCCSGTCWRAVGWRCLGEATGLDKCDQRDTRQPVDKPTASLTAASRLLDHAAVTAVPVFAPFSHLYLTRSPAHPSAGAVQPSYHRVGQQLQERQTSRARERSTTESAAGRSAPSARRHPRAGPTVSECRSVCLPCPVSRGIGVHFGVKYAGWPRAVT